MVTKKSAGTDSGQTGIGHPHIDARSRDRARIVVERIDADPSLFNVAHENLEQWRRLHGTLSRANGEWEQILKRPWCEIREILLEDSDEGQRLRSSHPFIRIVTVEERLEIMKRHLPPWPHEPYDPAKIPPEVMEKILSEGTSPRSAESPSSRRRNPPRLIASSGSGPLGKWSRSTAYRFTVDRREAPALERIPRGYESMAMEPVVCGREPTAVWRRTRAPREGDVAPARYDDNRNGRITCKEARRHGIAPVRRAHPAYRYMRDGDGDGVVCE